MYGRNFHRAKKKRKQSFLQIPHSASIENRILDQQEKVPTQEAGAKRRDLIKNRLTEKYARYEASKAFIHYLQLVEEVFTQAKMENWTIEKTCHDFVEAEINLITQRTEIDRTVLEQISEEFTQTSQNLLKIQRVADRLIERYANESNVGCVDFIKRIRDYFLTFWEALNNDLTLDETRERVIYARIGNLAEISSTPEHIFRGIYEEYIGLLAEK